MSSFPVKKKRKKERNKERKNGRKKGKLNGKNVERYRPNLKNHHLAFPLPIANVVLNKDLYHVIEKHNR